MKDLDCAALFFFPKANTPGCIKQANHFKELMADFDNLNCKVYGVSKDSPKALANWKTNADYPFDFISDTEGVLATHFEVNKEASVIRSHVVIKNGTVIDIQRGVKPLESAPEALKALSKKEEAPSRKVPQVVTSPSKTAKSPVKSASPKKSPQKSPTKAASPKKSPQKSPVKAASPKKSPMKSPVKASPVTSPKKTNKE